MKRRAAECAADMLKRVRIQIVSERCEMVGDLFSGKPLLPRSGAEWQRMEMMSEARYHDNGTRVSIFYKEGAPTGLEGSEARISYHKAEPNAVIMQRTGSVKTELIFEPGMRHECVYRTPIMPFEVCVHTERVGNSLDTEGVLRLDYIVQLKGADPERTKMTLTLLPDYDAPQGIR